MIVIMVGDEAKPENDIIDESKPIGKGSPLGISIKNLERRKKFT